MSTDKVPLLTAEMAVLLRTYDPSVARPQLLAIADGRAVVVPSMTEAEARERLIAWLRSEIARFGGDWVPSPQQTWIAALRDLGVIRD